MFVKLENGELLNLAHAVRIFKAQSRDEEWSIEAEYQKGNLPVFGVIYRGTEPQCDFAWNNLVNSLEVVST